MRAAIAIVASGLLILMQAMVALSPHVAEQAKPCRCCACGSQACCAQSSAPAPTPVPLASQRASTQTESISVPAQPTAAVAAPALSFLDTFLPPAPLPASALPLFRRDCALLI